MRAIMIRNSSRPEPAFAIPADAGINDVELAIQLLATGAGLDAGVATLTLEEVKAVPLVQSDSAASFVEIIAAFAARASHELASREQHDSGRTP